MGETSPLLAHFEDDNPKLAEHLAVWQESQEAAATTPVRRLSATGTLASLAVNATGDYYDF